MVAWPCFKMWLFRISPDWQVVDDNLPDLMRDDDDVPERFAELLSGYRVEVRCRGLSLM